MNLDQDLFTGGVFHPDLDDGRSGAAIDLDTSAMHATTGDGRRFTLRYHDCRLRIGGASGRMVFCRDTAGELTIFCEERGFPQALERAAGGLLAEQFADARAAERRARAGSRNLLLGLAAVTVLLLVGGYFGIMAAGRAALAAAPPSIDEKIGEMAIAQMDLRGPEVEDPAVIEPLAALLDRLATVDPEDPFSYTLTVVDAEIVNAFALPGGQIALYTGLLQQATHPDQVAGVLAHEIAHVTQRHGVQGIARSIGLVVAIQFLLGDAGGLIAVASELGRFAAENAYSRDQEAESDRLGVQRLHAAGIDPEGMAQFFALLQREELGAGVPAWMSTHPDHEARIAAIRDQAATLSPANYAPAIPTDRWQALRSALAGSDDSEPTPLPEETSDGRHPR